MGYVCTPIFPHCANLVDWKIMNYIRACREIIEFLPSDGVEWWCIILSLVYRDYILLLKFFLFFFSIIDAMTLDALITWKMTIIYSDHICQHVIAAINIILLLRVVFSSFIALHIHYMEFMEWCRQHKFIVLSCHVTHTDCNFDWLYGVRCDADKRAPVKHLERKSVCVIYRKREYSARVLGSKRESIVISECVWIHT